MNIAQAAKRIQQLGDLVEKLIQQSNELRERMIGVEETVDDTNERVAALEETVRRQGAILEALADSEGVDVDAVAAEVEEPANASDDPESDAGDAAGD